MKDYLPWLNPDYQNFMLTVELGSISAAARKLGRDLGNLSRSLTKLENLHGGPLLVRHQTGVRPTAKGSELFRALVSASTAFDDSVRTKEKAIIRIGFAPAIGFGFFGESFFSLLSELKLTPNFKLASSLELFELLKSRELDFILSPRSPKFPGIISAPIFTTRLALCSKQGKETRKLIRSSQMFDLAKRLEGLEIDETIIMDDFFVAAKFLSESDEFMGILPECILSNFPEVKVIKPFFDEKVSAITWNGSPGVQLLRRARQKIRRF